MQLFDVLLVNPLSDGMNLVAKEGVMVNHKDGVLVLSEFAGAFYELGEFALTVSPFDIYGTANAIHQALTMPPEEKRQRSKALKAIVTKADIRRWFSDQVEDVMRAFSSQAKKDSTSGKP
jgi:trehalose 6-phosphate synthase